MAKDLDSAERRKLADEGKALPDGSFPIRNREDLRDAVQSFGRAKDKAEAKRWIKKRARELRGEKDLPEACGKSSSRREARGSCP
jgi:hypothetical protein